MFNMGHYRLPSAPLRGEQVGTRRRYDDKLRMFLLRRRTPFDFAPLPDLRHPAGVGTRPLPASTP